VNAALRTPEMKASLDKLAGKALGGPPQELKNTIEADLGKWGPIVKALNLSTD
jgi:tripartite-type tricarboxylate transporter receptor subunit TctC